jgi:hypothetical protein
VAALVLPILFAILWIGTCLGAIAITLGLTWLIRARNVGRRLLAPAMAQLPRDVPERNRPRFRAFVVRRGSFSKSNWSMPKVSLLDPKSHTVETVAVLDAIANAYLSWSVLKQGVVLATDYVERISLDILRFDAPLRAGMEQLAHLSGNVEALVEAILPAHLWTWFEHTHLMQFAHAVQAKIEALDAGNFIDFQPEGVPTDFDFSMHFPWVTAILSSAREIRLLYRNDTTLDRALGHVALDVAAVSGGVFLGTGVGALALTLAAAALDVTVTGGVATAILAFFGIGGGLAGAKASRKIKGLRLEALSEQYARESVEVATTLTTIERKARKRFQRLARTIEKRQTTLRKETKLAWRSEITRVIKERDVALTAFAAHAPGLVQSKLTTARTQLTTLNAKYTKRRHFIWWPSATNVSLWLERRFTMRTVESLERATRELKRCQATTIDIVWPILRQAVADDPLLVVAPALVECAEQDREFERQLAHVDAQNREMAQRHYEDLQTELDERTSKILASVDSEMSPVLEPLRELDEELCREAAALGRRRRAA